MGASQGCVSLGCKYAVSTYASDSKSHCSQAPLTKAEKMLGVPCKVMHVVRPASISKVVLQLQGAAVVRLLPRPTYPQAQPPPCVQPVSPAARTPASAKADNVLELS